MVQKFIDKPTGFCNILKDSENYRNAGGSVDKLCTTKKWRVWKHLYMLEKTATRVARGLIDIIDKEAVVVKKINGRWVVLYWG